ncbi:glycosyltransferase family 4 protein [Vallitalea sediminicola]
MKRILFVIPFLSSGGAERVVSIWTSELAKLGIDVHLLVFYRLENEYSLDKKVIIHTVKHKKNEYDNLAKVEKIRAIRHIFQEIKPDVILPFITHVGLITSIAKIGLHLKVIETIRIDPRYSPRKKIIRWLRNMSIFFSDRCIVQNKTQLEYFPPFMQKSMVIFPNPIANEFVQKEKVFINKEICNFVTVGRLEKQKNYFMLLRAFSQVSKDNEKINLKIYGEGSLFNQLNDYIDELNLKQKVLLCGRTNNIVEVLQESDLFILSSDAEGMPNSLMEAMAVGLPCISTNCPTGPADLIEDGINGALIPVGNQDALVDSMFKMINNIDDSINMGRSARETILSRYTAEASVKEIMGFIESI